MLGGGGGAVKLTFALASKLDMLGLGTGDPTYVPKPMSAVTVTVPAAPSVKENDALHEEGFRFPAASPTLGLVMKL